MASHTWVPPETKLDPEQRQALRMIAKITRNVLIEGFAGSGKSILLVHAMRQLAPKTRSLGFVVYTRALVNLFEAGLGEYRDRIPVETVFEFLNSGREYEVALIDEIQDFRRDWLEIVRRRCRRVIAAGDRAQSIYQEAAPYSQLKEILDPTSVHLKIVHRITPSIHAVARHFAELALPKYAGGSTRDASVRLWEANDPEEEIAFVWNSARQVAEAGNSVAILAPRRELIVTFAQEVLELEESRRWQERTNSYGKHDFRDLNSHLASHGVPLQVLGSGAGDLTNPEDGEVRLLTYHSAKGLDFNTVFLPFLDHELEIFGKEEIATRLFFVALTRSRLNLHLSYSSRWGPHPFVRRIEDDLVREEIESSYEELEF